MTFDWAILDPIEKFIEEHESAGSTPAQFRLLKDQLAVILRKSADLQDEVAALKSANAHLTGECERRALRIRDLELAAQHREQEERSAELPGIEHRILKMLAAQDQGLSERLIVEGLGGREGLAVYHLENLAKREYVLPNDDTTYAWSDWYITPKGRDYLTECGEL